MTIDILRVLERIATFLFYISVSITRYSGKVKLHPPGS